MKEFWEKYSTIVYRTIVISASILCMVYFMPRKKYDLTHYELNKPWEHEQLIAEFDFNVMKSNEQLVAERDSAKRSIVPYFTHSGNVAKDKVKELRRILMKDFTFSKDDIEVYRSELEKLYNTGIVSDSDAESIEKSKYRKYRNGDNDPQTITFKSATKAREALYNINPGIYDTIPLMKDSFINALSLAVVPNYALDNDSTTIEQDKAVARINPVSHKIINGQRIINNREVVNAEKFRTIETYFNKVQELEDKEEQGNRQNIFYGQLLFTIIIMLVLLFYILLYQRDIANSNRKFTFTILAVTAFPTIAGVLLTFGGASIYIIPFAIAPTLLCLFINSSIAIVAHMTSVLVCSVMQGSAYEFIILQLATGMSAILSLKELSSRSQMFRCALATLITSSLTYMCYILIVEADVSKANNAMYFYFFVNSTLMTLIYPLMLIVEKLFGFVSSVTLIELSNFNNKLLQKLSQETPGTFQHSIQVGNLAAEAANEIGANSLEVRTGALYHDIGKTENPIYFTENQSGGISPHKALTPIESARVIIKHVTDGLAIAKREKLPKKIQEFITTHHGLSKTGYFYITYKNEHPDEVVDERLFTYPGPQPYTKEQAILTMADCVEAASHSLKEYTEENISTLVDNIIDPKVKNGEFSMSPLTFQDVAIIKKTFKKRLMAIYHTRISYPTEKK